ncbi:efflux transporter outer membrane subunit [Burkholderia plantarii]|uniref:efflux transporter outer membrane subunit n=1 Tax=Burkholderia plantarii TaxID=41899 RepID=UPI000ABFD086|nr:efflux transporter outer membrane subunit [Burkholderia plantarii]
MKTGISGNGNFIGIFLLAGLALSLVGCDSIQRSAYERPELSILPNWHGPTSDVGCIYPSSWWTTFHDPVLDRLIEKAITTNWDLATAVLNLRQARLQVVIAREQGYPLISSGISLSASRSFKVPTGTTKLAATSLSASWQLDLWGNIADQVDAAEWEARASEQDRSAVAMSVTSQVADYYWQLALLEDQIDRNQEAIQYEEKTVQLVQTRHDIGVATAIDLAMAKQALNSAEQYRLSLVDQRTQVENSLSMMIGDSVGTRYAVSAGALRDLPPAIPAGVPADILAHRPDVKAAELRLIEAMRQIDIVRTSFYPTFGLTAAGGTSSVTLRNLLENPVGSIAASMAFPFLNAWRVKSQTKSVKITYEQHVVEFKKIFYQALVDVENALSSFDNYKQQVVKLQQAAAYALEEERAYAIQYKIGTGPLQALLDANEAVRSAELSLSLANYDALVSEVALFAALGGGVELPQ